MAKKAGSRAVAARPAKRRWSRGIRTPGERGRRWVAALSLAAVAAASTAVPAAGDVRIRKDVKDLTADERREYVAAIKELKRTPSPYGSGRDHFSVYTREKGISWYDQFVLWHQALSRCDPAEARVALEEMEVTRHRMTGHNGPLFLPWHRAFLLLFEEALREVSGEDVAVPYWDWTSDASTKAMFREDFMGHTGDPDEGWALMEGPFRREKWNNFPVRNEGLFWSSSSTSYITRKVGEDEARPGAAEVADALSVDSYDHPPFDDSSDETRSFRNALEGWRTQGGNLIPDAGPSRAICGPDGWLAPPLRELQNHNAAHEWIGGILAGSGRSTTVFGTMLSVPASPNDPIFFLLHSNIDRLWAVWQEDHPKDPFTSDPDNPFDAPDRRMEPFASDGEKWTPRKVERLPALGYRYEAPRATVPRDAGSGGGRPRTRPTRADARPGRSAGDRRAFVLCRLRRPGE